MASLFTIPFIERLKAFQLTILIGKKNGTQHLGSSIVTNSFFGSSFSVALRQTNVRYY